jgi:Zinc-finger of C2H2 type
VVYRLSCESTKWQSVHHRIVHCQRYNCLTVFLGILVNLVETSVSARNPPGSPVRRLELARHALGSLPPTPTFSVPSLTNSCPSTPILTDPNLPPAFSLSTEIPDLNLSTTASNRSPIRSQQVETDPSDPVSAEPVTNSSPPLRSQPIETDRPNPVVPAPLRSQPRAIDRIPRNATPTQPNGSAQSRRTSAQAQPTTATPRSIAVLRDRETRTGSRLARLAAASTIRNQRRLWKCSLCDLTLTSAKAKHDHINGRRHKARVEERHGYCCGPCDLHLSSARDLDTHTKGRRHLRAIASRNSH